LDVGYFGGIQGQRDGSLESADQHVVVFVLYAAACRIMGMVDKGSSLVQCWSFDPQLGAETGNGGRYRSDSRSGMATASICPGICKAGFGGCALLQQYSPY
jgi:hypothetical protein